MEQINERIKSAVEEIVIVDSHEHTMTEADRNDCAVDFSYFFAGYIPQDLISAGMTPELMEAVNLPVHDFRVALYKRGQKSRRTRVLPEPVSREMTLEERWAALEPFWEAVRNTAYARRMLIAARDIFGIDDINRDTYHQLSQAIATSRQPGCYRHILKEKAKIEISILNMEVTDVDPEFFVPVMCLDQFALVQSKVEFGYLEEETRRSISSLDDLVKAMLATLKAYVASGIVGIKNYAAFSRVLQFDNVSRGEAEAAFSRVAGSSGEGVAWAEVKPLQDYMMHQIVQAAAEAGLPVQIHTGIHDSNRNIITNANPTHLISLFYEHPRAKFDLFHGGYPYIHEWAVLAKTFPNVFVNMAWVYVISPEIGRQVLREIIETVPGNKIIGFGGDEFTVEMTYAHSWMARQAITVVLSEKVASGYMTEEEAITLARRMLRDNPAALFKLPVS